MLACRFVGVRASSLLCVLSALWEALSTVQLREKCNELGVVPVDDKRRSQVLRHGFRAARGAVQQAAAAAAGSSGGAAAAAAAAAAQQ
jgi:hypothetical protein